LRGGVRLIQGIELQAAKRERGERCVFAVGMIRDQARVRVRGLLGSALSTRIVGRREQRAWIIGPLTGRRHGARGPSA
jgi:hypothetical protein